MMRKYIAVALLVFMSLTLSAQGVPKSRLISIVDKYSACEEVDVVKIGSLGTLALKNLILTSMASEGADQDVLMLMDMIKGVKKMAVMDYEDCPAALRAEIRAEIEDALKGVEVIMETKDEGSTVRMYGVFSEKQNRLSDFVLFTPQDCSLICLFGNVSLDAVSKMANAR